MIETCVIAYLSFCIGTLPTEMKAQEGGLHDAVTMLFNETDSAKISRSNDNFYAPDLTLIPYVEFGNDNLKVHYWKYCRPIDDQKYCQYTHFSGEGQSPVSVTIQSKNDDNIKKIESFIRVIFKDGNIGPALDQLAEAQSTQMIPTTRAVDPRLQSADQARPHNPT